MKPLPIGCPPTVSLLGNGPRWTLLLGLHAEEYKANNPAWTIGIASPTTLHRGQDRLPSLLAEQVLSSCSISSEIWSANFSQSGETRQDNDLVALRGASVCTGSERKSVRRAVVRPLEARLDPRALVADGLDDDGHFCTHLGSSFLWGERIDGAIAPRRRGPAPKTAFST